MERMLTGGKGIVRPKTKIVCTLGPASRSVEMIERLLKAGMNVARFNFSHGSHAYHQQTLDNLRTAMLNTGILCAVMLDTKGPEIRTGFLKHGKPIQLIQGKEITISTDYSIKGDENTICMSYKKLAQDLKPGSVILCSDGTITFTVLDCDKELGLVRCRCDNSAVLGERKNVNLLGVVVDLPTLTDKDKEDILQWGVPNKVNMIALSFVRKGSDLVEVRKLLGKHGKNTLLMSKVENQEGVTNFDDILANSDAFMVARGDLGMEIPIEKIFLAQKLMILKANIQGKPVVTATQMLESMIKSPRRLEPKPLMLPMRFSMSLASSVVRTAESINASLILVLTRGGTTAKLVAKYRPSVPILSMIIPEITTDSLEWSCNDEAPSRHCLIFRGLIPVLSSGLAKASYAESTEETTKFALQYGKEKGLIKPGDSVVSLYPSVIKILTVS
ncbi:hypothetical protein GOBAR_DD12746 [Gossypium barbadense]|nr:hypothetical protein GOBAR_DD12746 [Gossypium barbadense]